TCRSRATASPRRRPRTSRRWSSTSSTWRCCAATGSPAACGRGSIAAVISTACATPRAGRRARGDMSLWATLPGGIAIHRTEPERAARLGQLQIVVFPTLADAERFKAPHYLRHIAQFPDGQFCAVDRRSGDDGIVGMTSTIRIDFDFDHVDHTFADIIAGG